MNVFVAKQWQTGEQLPAGELNRIEQGIADAHSKIDGGEVLDAARTAAAEAVAGSSLVTAARVVDGRLVFEREDGTLLDAGSVAGTPGDPGAPGAPGEGLKTYASVADLLSVTSTEIGKVQIADLGAAFFITILNGIAAEVVVQSVHTVELDGDEIVSQTATLFYPGTLLFYPVQRTLRKPVGGSWGLQYNWFDGSVFATESSPGVAYIATIAQAQAMTNVGSIITPGRLANAAATTPTNNRLARYSSAGRLQSNAPSAAADVATKSYADTGAWAAVPASPTSTGTVGARAYDASWLYVCVAANTWRRVALAAW